MMIVNKKINTISEEQVLHNKLSFEINQELIHLMKRIVELQQENARLKDKIEKAINFVDKYMDEWDFQDEVWKDMNDLLILLKEN